MTDLITDHPLIPAMTALSESANSAEVIRALLDEAKTISGRVHLVGVALRSPLLDGARVTVAETALEEVQRRCQALETLLGVALDHSLGVPYTPLAFH